MSVATVTISTIGPVEDLKFSSIVHVAETANEVNYTTCLERVREIEERTAKWVKEYTDILADKNQSFTYEVMKNNVLEKLDYYIDRRPSRGWCKDLVDLYDKAIAMCEPEPLHEPTMTTLKKLGCDTESMERKHRGAIADVNRMKIQRVNIATLYSRIQTALINMKKAGEPFAQLYYDAGLKGYAVSLAHSTYYFSSAVKEREKNRSDKSENKTNDKTT